VALQRIGIRDAQQRVQQPAVAQIAARMFHHPLQQRRLAALAHADDGESAKRQRRPCDVGSYNAA